jgi:hypothetical protein
VVQAAPEPGDVYWENLAASAWSHHLWDAANTLAMTGVVLLSLGVLTAVSTVRAIVLLNEEYQGLELLLSLVGAGISVGTNALLERLCSVMSHLEKPRTRTAYERSVFSKLAPAFVINTAIAPLVVGCLEAARSGVFSGAGANGDARVLAKVAQVLASVFGTSATGARSTLTLTPSPKAPTATLNPQPPTPNPPATTPNP